VFVALCSLFCVRWCLITTLTSLTTTDLAEEFERSYLLLAELYVERGKFDLAQVTVMKLSSYNGHRLMHSLYICVGIVD
jgi:hypothetical protein